MKYIKLTAKADTWFKFGTEVLWEDINYVKRRPTLEEWESIELDDAGYFFGIRVCEDNPCEIGLGYKPGDEREDVEWCSIDEFEIEIVPIDYSIKEKV